MVDNSAIVCKPVTNNRQLSFRKRIIRSAQPMTFVHRVTASDFVVCGILLCFALLGLDLIDVGYRSGHFLQLSTA